MAIQQQGTGYRDPAKSLSIKALQARSKAAAEAASQSMQMPTQISDPWQGAAHLSGVLGANINRGRAEAEESAGRSRLAEIVAGIDPVAGPTQQQQAEIRMLDEDFANKIYEDAMETRRQEDQQKHALELQTGEQTFTAGESEKTRTATAAENELNRQADIARQKAQDAAADNRQDDAQLATEELARINAELDVEKKRKEQEIEVEGIGPESAAKVAEAERLGLKPGSPEYQKFVFDISPTAGTSIINQVGGGKKLDETLDVEEGKIWTGHQKERNVAAGSQKDMTMLSELVKQAPQGPIMGTLANLPILKGFSSAGVAFNSIVKRVAPTLRVEGSGSTSDIEYQGMLDSLPALGNFPEANALIIGMMQAKSAINIERGNTVDAYRNGEITDIQARQKLAEINQRSISNPELEALFEKIAKGEGGTGAPAEAPAEAPATGGDPEVDRILNGG